MRGYLSFLLVLSIMVCIFAFLAPFPQLHSTSDYAAIEAERTNSISMNIKEAIILSTSYWLRASAFGYDSAPTEEKNPVERELAIKAGILSGWTLLSAHQFSEDFEVELWCGHINSGTKQGLSKEMVEEGRVISCTGCQPLYSPGCTEFIQLHQKETPEGRDRVRLTSSSPLPTYFGAVGASIYSPKYGTANVVYIPLMEWIQ